MLSSLANLFPMNQQHPQQPNENQPEDQLPDDLQDLANRLFEAARSGNAELITYIDSGVPVDLANHEGNTFLMLAAYAGHAALVTALAERGADPNRLNDRGQSPLAGAVFKKEDDVIEALLHAGADPLAGSPTAVDTAKLFGREDLVSRFTADEK